MQITVCCNKAVFDSVLDCPEHGLSHYPIGGGVDKLVNQVTQLEAVNEGLNKEIQSQRFQYDLLDTVCKELRDEVDL